MLYNYIVPPSTHICTYTQVYNWLIPIPCLRLGMTFNLPEWGKEWPAWPCPLLHRPGSFSRTFSGTPHWSLVLCPPKMPETWLPASLPWRSSVAGKRWDGPSKRHRASRRQEATRPDTDGPAVSLFPHLTISFPSLRHELHFPRSMLLFKWFKWILVWHKSVSSL